MRMTASIHCVAMTGAGGGLGRRVVAQLEADPAVGHSLHRPGSPRTAALATRAATLISVYATPGGGGPPVPLRSCCVPQSRHSRYRLPSGPRRRCQRWSRSLHRQGLAIAAPLA